MNTIIKNKRAYYEYHVLDTYEAGMVLRGSEVKSIRRGALSFQDAYCRIRNGELWLQSLHISVYDHAGYSSHEPLRMRKLLLRKQELHKVSRKVKEKHVTLIPLAIGISESGFVKCTVGLCQGKQLHQKKQVIRERDLERDAERTLRHL